MPESYFSISLIFIICSIIYIIKNKADNKEAVRFKYKKYYFGIITGIIMLILFVIGIFTYPNSKELYDSVGYCYVGGSYMNRVPICNGDYSDSAKERAESIARNCNSTSNPISGCNDGKKYYEISTINDKIIAINIIIFIISLFCYPRRKYK